MNHFTDKDGYNAIRSQTTWLFKAEQPRAPNNPVGFIPPAEPELLPLPGGRGRLKTIFYSRVDYPVARGNQLKDGATGLG